MNDNSSPELKKAGHPFMAYLAGAVPSIKIDIKQSHPKSMENYLLHRKQKSPATASLPTGALKKIGPAIGRAARGARRGRPGKKNGAPKGAGGVMPKEEAGQL